MDTEPAPGSSTLVEFTLTAEDDGTLLRVVESGFDTLTGPAAEIAEYHAGNVDGWRHELGDLAAYLETVPA
jgi:uncharacterized protein YndB with AHSA1/START domain